ncbi:3'-5' exonuclease [Acetobacterium bakii]|uniref:3'-5' exonuclease n=1 Tax=Acetobacterium bakii TaxID=52689 RepID=UPI000680233D|nr:3'-5' exonuclease [Acetobacterium bakii]
MSIIPVLREFKGKSLIVFPDDYVIIDIETTGFNPKNDEIIEIGAVKVCNNEITSIFQSLIKPRNPINNYISNLTGITDEMVVDSQSEKEVLDAFTSFAADSLLMGHNINYDINFLYDHCKEHLDYYFKNNFIDIMDLLRKKTIPLQNQNIMALCEKCAIRNTNAHRALSDCLAINDLFQHLKRQYKPTHCIGKLDVLNFSAELGSKHPLNKKKCPIGKSGSAALVI